MKKSDYLKLTDFDFSQENIPYKVNSDTVVLGSFLDRMKGKSVLDIGTNSGALLLYAFWQGAGHLVGVDIHKDALELAKINLDCYTHDHELICGRIQDLDIGTFDVVICNPPFFEMNNVTQDPYLKEAMFEESLPLEDLFSCFRKTMKANGVVYLIYQADRFPEVYEMCKKYKLKIMKMAFVHDIHSTHALRVVLKLKIGPMSKLKVYDPIILDSGEFLNIRDAKK